MEKIARFVKFRFINCDQPCLLVCRLLTLTVSLSIRLERRRKRDTRKDEREDASCHGESIHPVVLCILSYIIVIINIIILC